MPHSRRLAALVLIVPVALSLIAVTRPHASADYLTFIMSGRALAAGRNPYGVYPDLIPESGGAYLTPNLNPPLSLLVFGRLTGAAGQPCFWAWVAISACLVAACLALLSVAYRRPLTPLRLIWALGCAGLGHTLYLGQVYAPLALLAGAAWVLLDRRRPVWAGILIGIIAAIKPNFIIWPVVLLLSGSAAAGCAGLAVAAGLSLLALAVLGPAPYGQWLAASSQTLASVSRNFLSLSLTPLAARAGLGWLGAPLSVLLLAAVAWWAWRRKPGPHAAGSAALAAGILAAPVAWPGYTLLLLPAFLARPLASRLWRAAAAGLAVPFALVDIAGARVPRAGYAMSLAYTLALLAVLLAVVAAHSRWAGSCPESKPASFDKCPPLC